MSTGALVLVIWFLATNGAMGLTVAVIDWWLTRREARRQDKRDRSRCSLRREGERP